MIRPLLWFLSSYVRSIINLGCWGSTVPQSSMWLPLTAGGGAGNAYNQCPQLCVNLRAGSWHIAGALSPCCFFSTVGKARQQGTANCIPQRAHLPARERDKGGNGGGGRGWVISSTPNNLPSWQQQAPFWQSGSASGSSAWVWHQTQSPATVAGALGWKCGKAGVRHRGTERKMDSRRGERVD